MWVYREMPGIWEVGYCEPVVEGDLIPNFVRTSIHSDPEDAARRVNYLNGGTGEAYDWKGEEL